MNNKERLLLVVLASINFTNIMDFMIMMPLGPQLMDIFAITPGEFGWLVSSYTFSAAASGLLASFVIDRFDRKRFLQVLYVGFLLGTLACGLAPSYHLLILARVFTGVFGGVLGAVILSIVGDVFPFERRGQAMGAVMAAFSIASVLGVPFGLRLANMYGWNAPFLFLALLALPIQAGIYFYVPNLNAHRSQQSQKVNVLESLLGIMRNPNQRKAISLMMVVMFGHFSIIPFLSPYMVGNVGFTQQQLELIYLFGGLGTIVSSPLIGRLADKAGKRKVFIIFVSLCCIPVLIITHLPQAALWMALVVTTTFFVLSSGRFIPAQAMVTATVDTRTRGSFMSIVSSMQQLSAALASIMAGLIVVKQPDNSLLYYNVVGYISVGAALITLLLVGRIKTHDGKSF